MKDKSLEELLDDLSFYSDVSDEHYKIQAEIMRRFRKLENKLNTDSQLFQIACLKAEVEKLQCCGNCKDYPYDLQHCRKKIYKNYCSMWTTDGLSREEREK
jgi:hypothetical protein